MKGYRERTGLKPHAITMHFNYIYMLLPWMNQRTEQNLKEKRPWRPERENVCHAGRNNKENTEEFRCVCARLSTCEGSVTLSVTTSSLVYLIKRWCSSNSCIFHILNLRSWSKNWKNLTTKKREHHLTRKWDGASTHRGVSVSQCWKSQVLGEEWHNNCTTIAM